VVGTQEVGVRPCWYTFCGHHIPFVAPAAAAGAAGTTAAAASARGARDAVPVPGRAAGSAGRSRGSGKYRSQSCSRVDAFSPLPAMPVLQEEADTLPIKKPRPEAGDVGVPGAASGACQK
jgi:hypothetical protein